MISFICATNDEKQYDDYIGQSLSEQNNKSFEIIKVDTIVGQYSSAAEALNFGASKATGDYLVFLHQDVCFKSRNFVDELVSFCENNDFLIAGCAGAIRKGFCKSLIVSNIINGNPPETPGIRVENVIPVEVVDECLFIIPRIVFNQHKFENLGKTWHLYAAEYSLWAKSQDKKNGVLMFPIRLWHVSKGASMSKDYIDVLDILRRKYRCNFYFTTSAWPRNRILYKAMVHRRKRQWRIV